MFDNKIVKVPALGGEEMHLSRVIASWVNAGGVITSRRWATTPFAKWCESLGMDQDDIRRAVFLASDGKLELQLSASKFLEDNE